MPSATDEPEANFTIRQPPYSYLLLKVTSNQSSRGTAHPPLDEVTIRQYTSFAMQQFLGLTGTAVPIDILRVEGLESIIRVPYQDSKAVQAALSQWTSATKHISIMVVQTKTWLGALARSGTETNGLWSLDLPNNQAMEI